MDAVFLKILNMSIAAGWIILAVVVLRFLLKKAPKWLPCVLWAVVAIRLVCPFSFESVFSLIPSAQTVSPEIPYAQNPVINSGIPAVNSVVNPVISRSFAPTAGASVNPLQIWITIASYVWLLGITAMLLYAAVSFLRLQKKVGVSLKIHDNVLMCDDIKTPFILGIIKPRIYLPSSLNEAQQNHVIAHEIAHLERRDHWWKPLGFLLLAIYWFNPLCWLAYILLCRDIELACDEKVFCTMEKDDIIAYSEALLMCSIPRRQVMACPLAFGEVGVKERIKTMLNFKKPALWIIIVAVIACIIMPVCFLTNPKDEEQDISFSNSENLASLADFLRSLAIANGISSHSEPLTITSNSKTVMPHASWLCAQTWGGDGWLAADGMSLMNLNSRPELSAGLPTLVLADDFTLTLAENATFSCLSVYDEDYERIYYSDSLDRLDALPSGTYYVSIVVSLQGAYIAEGEDYEANCYECVFKLIVADTDSVSDATSDPTSGVSPQSR